MTCRARACQAAQLIASLTGLWSLVLLGGCGISSPTSQNAAASAGSSSTAASVISEGAQLGLAWSAGDATLRPVIGVPGSAQFGASLVPAGSYANAAFSPQSQSALIVDNKSNLYLLVLPSTQPALLTQVGGPNATIVFAPLGGYAVIYSPGGSTLTVISGLPKQPIAAQIQAGAAIQAAAISDAGTTLIAAAAGNGGVAIASIPAAGAQTAVTTMGGYGGMAFLPASEDILLADSSANTLARLRNGTLQALASAKDGLNQPLAVAASLDSHWAVTANRADGTLVRVDLTMGTPTVRSTCSCSPSTLLPLTGNAVFELTPPGTSAAWMVEADDLVPRVLFIPPARHS